MDWYQLIFELIDMRSFSNLWYWIALAVLWSSTSHFVLGVPFDMAVRAQRHGGEAERDFEDMVRLSVNRILYIARVGGVWLSIFVPFVLAGLATLGFWYDIEFAQAVFLLGAPLVIVGVITVSAARRIERDRPTGKALRRLLVRTRFWVQLVGMVSIFVTAMWGMYQNILIGGLWS